MKKKMWILGVSFIMLLTFAACSKPEKVKEESKKIKVLASFNAIADITREIGGDKIELSVMVPKGVEAHDFEPKPKDMAYLNEAKLFVYNGLGMEGWAESALKTVNNNNLVSVEASKYCNLIENKEENHDHDKEEEHSHGKYDPHVWLSLKDANIMAKNILDGLLKVDGENKEYYLERYKKFMDENSKLLQEYDEKFSKLSNKTILVGHEAFSYLARDFKITQKGVQGVFAEGEATSNKLKELVEYSKTNNIKTIFMEKGGSSKVSETVAKEVGAKVETLNTLESEGNYRETMRENLEKIYNVLK